MATPQLAFDPTRTLVILFGASIWEAFPGLAKTDGTRAAYGAAHAAVRAYLTAETGLHIKGLVSENGLNIDNEDVTILDLFNSEKSFLDQDKLIGDFIRHKITKDTNSYLDILLYYIGHGSTIRDGKFIFILRSTEQTRREQTAYKAADLAALLKREAPLQRKWLFLDCCASAAAFTDFKPSRSVFDSFCTEAEEIFPVDGTALFCACSADGVALVDEKSGTTMFTGALMEALKNGDGKLGERMTLSELNSLVRNQINQRYGPDGVRPELYDPDQRKGDLSLIPCFPNAALYQQNIEVRFARFQATMDRIAEQTASVPTLNRRVAQLEQQVRSQKDRFMATVDSGAIEPTQPTSSNHNTYWLPVGIWNACPASVKAKYLQWRASRVHGYVFLGVSFLMLVGASVILALRNIYSGPRLPLEGFVFLPALGLILLLITMFIVNRGGKPSDYEAWGGDTEPDWLKEPRIITALHESPMFMFGIPISRSATVLSIFVLSLAGLASGLSATWAYGPYSSSWAGSPSVSSPSTDSPSMPTKK